MNSSISGIVSIRKLKGLKAMKTLAVAGQKGGSGKSTILLSLAVEVVRNGRSVTVIDLDPQATAAKWADRRGTDSPLVVSAQAERLERVMTKADSEFVFIDTQGRASGEAITVSEKADLILLPCRPTIPDIEALTGIGKILATAAALDRAYVVWNACLSSTDTRIAAGITLVEDMGLKVCPHVLCQRVAYADALVTGHSASEVDGSSKAASEIAALFGWAMELI